MDCTDRRLGALASPSVTRRRSCNNGVWRSREQQPAVLLWVLTLEKFAFEVAAGVTCPCNTRGVFARQCLLSGGKAPPARGLTRVFGPTSTAHPLKRGGAQTEWHSYSPPPIFCYRPVTNGRIRVGPGDRNGRNADSLPPRVRPARARFSRAKGKKPPGFHQGASRDQRSAAYFGAADGISTV